MHGLALFAGAGGSCLADRLLGWRTVCAVEVSPFGREVLLRRQQDGLLDLFPIWDDVRTFRLDNPECGPAIGEMRRRCRPLVLTAGFPCQPYSRATQHMPRGEAHPEYLWPETRRVIEEIEPDIVFLENVAAILDGEEWGRIKADLKAAGYFGAGAIVGADDLGFPHHRSRFWVLAAKDRRVVADAYAQGLEGRGLRVRAGEDELPPWPPGPEDDAAWRIVLARYPERAPALDPQSDLRGVAAGMAPRMDRVAALGEGWVPVVAAYVFLALAREVGGEG